MRTSALLFLAALLPVAAGCAAQTEDADLAPVDETHDELRTVSKLVGDYRDGRGRWSTLSLAQVKDGDRTVNRFDAEQIVMCVRAPCPTIKVSGKWFARDTSLTIYPDRGERETFKVKLEESTLTLTNARGVEIAQLEKATPAPSDVAETLRRHGVPNMKVDVDARELEAQDHASGVRVHFDAAFDKAVEMFLSDDDGLRGVISGLEAEARDQCPGQRDLAKCIANDSHTSVSLQKRSDESAPHGETAQDKWVIVFFTSHFSDHGYYAVIDKKRAGDAAIYSFN